MKNKKRIILIISIAIVLLTTVFLLLVNRNNNYKKIDFKDINDHYNITIDIKNLIATIDGKKYKIDELDDVKKDKIYEYIKDNSYGKIKKGGNSVKITNPYSLQSLIVKTEDRSFLDKYKGIEKVAEIGDNLYKVTYKSTKDTKDGFDELKKDENIDSVSTDVKVEAYGNVNASKVTITAWGTQSMGLDFYTKKLEDSNNNTEVKVAVLDTGIRLTHEIFNTNGVSRISMDGAYDYENDDNDPTDDNFEDSDGNREYGHGTMVSGIIAQSTPKNVKIVPVKVLDEHGSGTLSTVLLGIKGVKDKVDIINLSLGASYSETPVEQELKKIYENSGVIIVTAAGNTKGSVSYPGSSPYTLAISSVDKDNKFVSWFSNYGPEIDFSAPGEDLFLADAQGDTHYISGQNGTSFSSPYAASAIALIKAENPSMTRDEIIDVLKHNVVDLGTKGKDNYYGWGSISIHTFINSLNVSDTWSKTNRLTVSANALSTENYYAITSEEKQPTSWTRLANTKNININKDIDKNGTYYLWIKNKGITRKFINGVFKNISNEGITHKKFTVNKVDKINPLIINNIREIDKTALSLSVGLTTIDPDSGISKIAWYYKRSNDSYYNKIEETINNETGNLVKEKTITGLASNTTYSVYAEIYDRVGNVTKTKEVNITTLVNTNTPYVTYKTHVQNIGWQSEKSDGKTSGTSGQSLRLEGIKIHIDNKKTYTGSVEYQTHIQNIGWQNYVTENNLSGTTGQSLRLEAIRIRLTGDLTNAYDIYYRVHVQNFGWLDWAKNGAPSGSAGYGNRLEAIEILMVEKGQSAPGKTTTPYVAKKLMYSTHVQNVGWQGYVSDGDMAGTSGRSLRLEGIKMYLQNVDYSGNIEYKTHVQNIGWQNYVRNNNMAGTSGKSLRLEAIQIRLTGEIANHYDIYYRVHVQNFGWLDWAKNNGISGTTGFAYRLEGIEAKLVEKGKTFTGSTTRPYIIK